MKFNKSGQAALEFLTTYGWAFLIIIVVFLGLNYFDVFDFSKRLPEGCSFPGKLACGESYVLNSNGSVSVQFLNNNLKAVTISDLAIIEKSMLTNPNLNDSMWCNQTGLTTLINPGKTGDLFANVSGDLSGCGLNESKGLKKSFEVKVTYSLAGTTISSVTSGQITATVQ